MSLLVIYLNSILLYTVGSFVAFLSRFSTKNLLLYAIRVEKIIVFIITVMWGKLEKTQIGSAHSSNFRGKLKD